MATAAQIAAYGYNAGWRNADLVVAVAVALAESRGNDKDRGDVSLQTSKWGPSIGLWQIRSLNAEKGKGSLRDEVANLDPQTNANHAYAIWKEDGWGAWTTHKNKAYMLFMPFAQAGVSAFLAVRPDAQVGSVVDVAVPDAVKDAATSALSIAAEPIRVLKWLTEPGTQMRVAKFFGGGVLMVAALYVVMTPRVLDAAGAVSNAIPIGKVAKVAGAVAKGAK